MPHVATDNASAPPAFTGSTSFPFLFPFKLFDSRKTICRNGSRLYSNLSQFQPHPAVAKAKLARIRAGVGQLINGAELMRRLVCSEKPSLRKCRGNSIFCACWRREAPMPLYDASYRQTLGCAWFGRRLGV